MTAADRPSVTDNARADAAHVEAERRYPPSDSSTMYPLDAVRTLMRGAFEDGAEWAAGRAETTTDPVGDAYMLGYATARTEETTPTTEDAVEEILYDAGLVHSGGDEGDQYIVDGPLNEVIRAVMSAITYAARPTPTREEIIDALVMSPLSDTAGTDLRPFEQTADAVLDLLKGGTDE